MADAARYLFIVLVGLVTGFASGAFGVGGSVVATPAVRMLLAQPSDIALGTTLPIVFPSALVGGFNYWRAGKIIPRIVAVCSLSGIAGTAIGSYATACVDTRYIMIATALVLFYLAWRSAATALGRGSYGCPRGEGGERAWPAWKLAAIGLAAGFSSGFLGVGGGVVLVPAFFFVLRLELKECLGNSLAVIAVLAIPGSIIHTLLGHVDWAIALAMVLGVMPGAWLGSFFTLRARDRRVLLLFSCFLFAIGIIFLSKEIRGLV